MRIELRARLAVLALVLVPVLALIASCTSSVSKQPGVSFSGKVNRLGTVTVPTVAGGRQVVVEMEMRDFAFKPTIVQVTEGSSFVLRLRNTGANDHTLTVTSLKLDVVVKPGQAHDVSVRDFRAGQIPFACRFHKPRGMQGGFLVLRSGQD